jgi:hypothetical protein
MCGPRGKHVEDVLHIIAIKGKRQFSESILREVGARTSLPDAGLKSVGGGWAWKSGECS